MIPRLLNLYDWDGTLAHERDRHRMGAHAVAADAARGVGGIVRGILDDEIALTPGNFFPVPVSIPLERDRSVVAGFHRSLCALGVASSRREDWCGISVAILRALRTTRGRCVAG